MKPIKTVDIKISEPVVVSQAPVGLRGWGPWQFPVIEKNDDGHLYIEFHIELDAASAYGKPKALFVSRDGGHTWVRDTKGIRPGVRMKNGDRILPYTPRSVLIDEIEEPKCRDSYVGYGILRKLYRQADFPESINRWCILRKRSHEQDYKKEKINVNIPGYLMRSLDGVLGLNFFWNLRPFPAGSICGMTYGKRETQNGVTPYRGVQFIVSNDNGYNWEMISEIPYKPDKETDPMAELRMGYGEQDITFMPDGSSFCLLRTTDGNGPGPLFCARSTDNMRSWSNPVYFDSIGVWPQLLTLDNGVSLASYGRPGIRLKATADKSGQSWDEPIELPLCKEPKFQEDSCSYTGMLKTGYDTALLVYSDFNFPDANGIKRKSIVVRSIKADSI